MNAEGTFLAELMRAEAELLSSQDSHQVIADRLGISENAVRGYCNHLTQRSRLPRCTHRHHEDGTSGQQLSWERLLRDMRQYQGQQPHQPSVTPDSQYGTPPGQPPNQHQARDQGTPPGQSYPQAPQQYDPELHRKRLHDQARQRAAGPGYGYGPQPPRPRRSRHLVRNVLAGTGAVVLRRWRTGRRRRARMRLQRANRSTSRTRTARSRCRIGNAGGHPADGRSGRPAGIPLPGAIACH
jgi:hypothetical protein